MTTGTTPKPRVIRFENPDMSGKSYLTLSVAALQWNRLRDVLRWRAIVATPRKCRICRDGKWHVERGENRTTVDCPRCKGTLYERCPACAAHVVDRSLDLDVETRIVDPPCNACINGVLHDEHEVGVRDAIEKGIAALMVASGIKGSVHAAAVLSTLIGDREGSAT